MFSLIYMVYVKGVTNLVQWDFFTLNYDRMTFAHISKNDKVNQFIFQQLSYSIFPMHNSVVDRLLLFVISFHQFLSLAIFQTIATKDKLTVDTNLTAEGFEKPMNTIYCMFRVLNIYCNVDQTSDCVHCVVIASETELVW